MKDIYAVITDSIIEDLEKGIIPWKRGWSVGAQGCYSYSTGKPYSLLNMLLLGGVSGDYVTFKGAQRAGGTVKRGEKSKTVVYWSMLEKEDENGNKETIPLLRSYNVFHTSQCEGLKPHHAEATLYDTHPIEEAEAILRAYAEREGIALNIGDYNEAVYFPATDTIQLPRIERFANPAEFYSTAFHELAHSTGAKNRLNRKLNESGRENYAQEELVAELASAFIMNSCGIDTVDTFENSEGYIQGWLKALRNDKRLIVTAAGRAEKAVGLILGKETDGE